VLHLRLRSDLSIVVVCVALYVGSAVQVRMSGGQTALSYAASAVAAPAVALANAAGIVWENYRLGQRNLEMTLEELGHLREEVGNLRRTNQLLGAEVAELREGSRLLAVYPSLTEHAVVARVLARDLLRTHSMRLDRGSADGIRLDAAVLAEGGLLGRVDRVLDHSAHVQLLTHPAAAAAATIVGVQAEGLLMGGDNPRVTGLPPYTKVPPDTPVLSTGSEGIYPPGMLFGTAVEARTEGLFTVVPVQLAAHPTEVTVVLVLAPAGKGTS